MLKARTIEMFLPTGNPQEIRIVRDTISPIKTISFSQSSLIEIKDYIQDINGCYILYGKDKEIDRIYIGESDSLFKRMKDHSDKKDFWSQGFVIYNETGTFDKAHLHFLEEHMIKIAREVSRCELENKNKGQMSSISMSKKAECLNYFETIKTLTSTLGLNIFKPKPKNITETEELDKKIFELKNRDNMWEAFGTYTEEGFTIFEGSKARAGVVAHLQDGKNTCSRVRKRLIEEGIVLKEGEILVFKENYDCNSPSMAATLITGRNSNGWKYWKEKGTGKTLDEIYRKE